MTPLEQRCHQTLEGSWTVGERDGVAFAYTRPSPGRYRWQWYWDSCFAAIAWRHLDPARSRAELETLLAAARPDGFIGHTIFWEHPGASACPLAGRDRVNDSAQAVVEPSAHEHHARRVLSVAKRRLQRSALELAGLLGVAYLVLKLIPALKQALRSLEHVSWEWVLGA